MTSTDAAILAGDAVCIQSCVPDSLKVPALIVLLADLAGVSDDPADLIKNSGSINACIPLGLQMAVLISLFSQIADSTPALTPPTPCENLIPNGAIYNYEADYFVPLTPGASYMVTFGANEAAFSNPGGSPPAGPSLGVGQTITITLSLGNSQLFLQSTSAGISVTATVCAI